MAFCCSCISLYTNCKNSKWTPEKSIISMDYDQSVSLSINKHISHQAEEKQKSHGYKNQTDMASLKNEAVSVINYISNVLAADNVHGSRTVRKSE